MNSVDNVILKKFISYCIISINIFFLNLKKKYIKKNRTDDKTSTISFEIDR